MSVIASLLNIYTRGLTSNSAQLSHNRFLVVALVSSYGVRLVMEPRRG